MTGERREYFSRTGIQMAITIFWAVAFQCLLALGAAARADFRIVKHTNGELSLLIYSTITENDAKALQELAADLQRDDLTVYLDSRGGDPFAAMQIGRLIRKYEGRTFIGREPSDLDDPLSAKCYSSCALIFISGVLRLSSGELGLHRPYLASAPQTRQAVEKQVPLMLAEIKQYIVDMGITDNFYEQMVNTEPSRMTIYNSDDYVKLVPENDPVYQEIEIAYEARHYGASTSEMRVRVRDSEACFQTRRSSADYVVCSNAALWGLNEQTYRERYERARTCRRSDDFNVLLAMPKSERRDHPLWIKWETCERNIMLHP